MGYTIGRLSGIREGSQLFLNIGELGTKHKKNHTTSKFQKAFKEINEYIQNINILGPEFTVYTSRIYNNDIPEGPEDEFQRYQQLPKEKKNEIKDYITRKIGEGISQKEIIDDVFEEYNVKISAQVVKTAKNKLEELLSPIDILINEGGAYELAEKTNSIIKDGKFIKQVEIEYIKHLPEVPVNEGGKYELVEEIVSIEEKDNKLIKNIEVKIKYID